MLYVGLGSRCCCLGFYSYTLSNSNESISYSYATEKTLLHLHKLHCYKYSPTIAYAQFYHHTNISHKDTEVDKPRR